MRRMLGRVGQGRWVRVRWMVETRSEARVGRERSIGASEEEGEEVVVVVVLPWPRASRERIPAVGRSLRSSEAKTAKERPEEPAPWWVTKSGPEEVGGVR